MKLTVLIICVSLFFQSQARGGLVEMSTPNGNTYYFVHVGPGDISSYDNAARIITAESKRLFEFGGVSPLNDDDAYAYLVKSSGFNYADLEKIGKKKSHYYEEIIDHIENFSDISSEAMQVWISLGSPSETEMVCLLKECDKRTPIENVFGDDVESIQWHIEYAILLIGQDSFLGEAKGVEVPELISDWGDDDKHSKSACCRPASVA